MGWRPILAAGGLVAAVALAVVIRNQSGPQIGSPVGSLATTSGESQTVADEESLNFVAQIASSVPYEEFQQVARPSVDATDAMVEQLTPQERVEFVRLLKAQIGSDD